MSASMFTASKNLKINKFVKFDAEKNADQFFQETGEYENFERLRPGLGCSVIIPTVFDNGERKNLILGYTRSSPDVPVLEGLQFSIGGGALDMVAGGYNQPIGKLFQSKMSAEVAEHAEMCDIFNNLTYDTNVHSNVQSDKKMNYATVIGIAKEMHIDELRKLLSNTGAAVRAAAVEKKYLKVQNIYAYDINEVREQISGVEHQYPNVKEGTELPANAITLTNYAEANMPKQAHRPFATTHLKKAVEANMLTDQHVAEISQQNVSRLTA